MSLLAAFGSMNSMHGLLRRLAGATPSAQRYLDRSPSRHHAAMPVFREMAPAAAGIVRRPTAQGGSRKSPVAMPLRVVSVMEPDQATPHGGRMRISGRMADVCAELDRMAARELALQGGV